MKTQDKNIKKYMARPQSEAGNNVSDYEDRSIRDIKIGDDVILSGKVVEIMEIQGRTVACVLFEHKTEKQTNLIKYWFNNIFLKQPEKQKIEIARPLHFDMKNHEAFENRKLIIELQKSHNALQKVVNKLLEK